MNFGSKILIFDAVEFFAALNNTCISDRTLLLLFLNCITTMHMNYSLFTLRSSLNFVISDRTIALLFLYNSVATRKFCITTMHMNYSLFTLRSSLNLSYPP